jgi:hypothetical protein
MFKHSIQFIFDACFEIVSLHKKLKYFIVKTHSIFSFLPHIKKHYVR